jgi:hypothetical protein
LKRRLEQLEKLVFENLGHEALKLQTAENEEIANQVPDLYKQDSLERAKIRPILKSNIVEFMDIQDDPNDKVLEREVSRIFEFD